MILLKSIRVNLVIKTVQGIWKTKTITAMCMYMFNVVNRRIRVMCFHLKFHLDEKIIIGPILRHLSTSLEGRILSRSSNNIKNGPV